MFVVRQQGTKQQRLGASHGQVLAQPTQHTWWTQVLTSSACKAMHPPWPLGLRKPKPANSPSLPTLLSSVLLRCTFLRTGQPPVKHL